MRDTALLLLLGLALAGCGSSAPAAKNGLDNSIEIWRAPSGDADFIAAVANRHTLIFNGDLHADRVNVIGARLKLLGCRDPRFLREKAEDEGGNHVLYYSAWKCG